MNVELKRVSKEVLKETEQPKWEKLRRNQNRTKKQEQGKRGRKEVIVVIQTNERLVQEVARRKRFRRIYRLP